MSNNAKILRRNESERREPDESEMIAFRRFLISRDLISEIAPLGKKNIVFAHVCLAETVTYCVVEIDRIKNVRFPFDLETLEVTVCGWSV